MKNTLLLIALVLLASPAYAGPKPYRVKGPIHLRYVEGTPPYFPIPPKRVLNGTLSDSGTSIVYREGGQSLRIPYSRPGVGVASYGGFYNVGTIRCFENNYISFQKLSARRIRLARTSDGNCDSGIGEYLLVYSGDFQFK